MRRVDVVLWRMQAAGRAKQAHMPARTITEAAPMRVHASADG